MNRELLSRALETLESLQGGCTDHDDGTVEAITVWCPELIDALRAALAQPEPIDGFGGNLDEAFEPAPAVPDGMALVPDYRGYAALGTGQYLLDISGDANPAELIIHVATDAEKEGRTVGDLRDKPNPGEVIQPEKMAVRLAFFTVAGLDALEQQLRILRETHFPDSAAPAVREPKPLTKELLQRHAMFAADAPPSSAVVLLSSLHRLLGIGGGGK